MGIDAAALVTTCRQVIEPLRQLILFGSCASGKATSTSDLDIAVQGAHALTADEKTDLIGRLSLLTGRPVDLIDLCNTGQPLLNQILSTGVRLYGSDHHFAELMLRNVVAHEDFVPLQKRLIRERLDAWIKS